MMASCCLCYRIAGDLFTVASTRHKSETEIMVKVIKAYIMALAVFDHLINKNCEATKKFAKKHATHLVHLNGKKEAIFFWLNGFLHNDFSLHNDLKVSIVLFTFLL